MSTTAIAATAYQTLALTQIHESTTNPRRTFEPTKLAELADSIRIHGLIQPITVRPIGDEFEIVAGARRFRAAQLAGLAALEAIVRNLTDSETLEVQIIENSQRQDVHPYEEAAGYQRLLDLPGYDVAALASKCGKSLSHVYARLTLLQLTPEVAEAFQHERISASHANLLARLTPEQQAEAFKVCWRKDYQDKEPHLLPAKHLATWIQSNLYLPLDEAPFSTEDLTLNAEAGACVTCPRRSGYNTQLFADVQGDQCFDAPCYQSKVTAMLDRQIASHPEFVQIETSWRNPKEQRPGILQTHQYRALETPENPDADPPCDHSRTALIVYGRGVGKTFPVCTDRECPIHDPRQAAYRKDNPAPVIEPPTEEESEEEAAERKAEYDQRQADYRADQERRRLEREAEEERQEKEAEAERERRDKLQKKRRAIFERIVKNAPPAFTADQLRMLLRAFVNLDPYTFADDLAVEFNGDDENDQRSAEEVLLAIISGLTDDKLTGFALHLALSGHRSIPRENEFDFLTEAEAVFAPKDKPAPGKKATAKTVAARIATAKKTKPKTATQKRSKA
jgi:ParB family chromosome partitioning protein